MPGTNEPKDGNAADRGSRALRKIRLPGLPAILKIGSGEPGKRRRRWLLLGVEFVAGIAVALAILAGLIAWRISDGEISLDFLAGPVERAINSELDGYNVRVGGAVLERADGEGGVSFRLRDLALHNDDGVLLAEVPGAAVSISPLQLLTGNIAPTSIDLIGPRLVVILRGDGRLEIDVEREHQELGSDPATPSQNAASLDEPEKEAEVAAEGDATHLPTATELKQILGIGENASAGSFFGNLDRVGVLDADLVFVHEKLGLRWQIEQGDLALIRDQEGIRYEASADLSDSVGGWPLQVTGLISDSGEGLKITIGITDFVPRQAATMIEGLGGLAMLDLPITAVGEILLDDNASVRHYEMSARLDAGFLRLGDDTDRGILVDEGLINISYDVHDNLIRVASSSIEFGDDRVTLNGSIMPPVAASEGVPENRFWSFLLVASEGLFTAEGVDTPLEVEEAKIMGRYDPQNGEIWVDRAEMLAGGTGIGLSGRIKFAARSPEIEISARFLPMGVDVFKQIWPAMLAPGARRWFFDNIHEGFITDFAVVADFPAGMIADLDAGAPIPPEALDMAFGFTGITAEYFWALPDLAGAAGRGRMKGGHFTVDVLRGSITVASGAVVEDVTGTIEIPNATKEPAIAYIRTTGSGSTKALLELMNYAPLEYADEIGLDPAEIGGYSSLELDLSVPLLTNVTYEDVNVAARAEIHEFAVPNLFGEQDVENGELILRVLPTRMEAAGEMELSGVATHLNWRRPFGVPGSGNLALRMRLDDEDRSRLGLDLDFLQGPVEVEIVPENISAPGSDLSILVDLSEASLSYSGLGWEKPVGVAGNVQFLLIRETDGTFHLDDFELTAPGTIVSGTIRIDDESRILSADFPEFSLNQGDQISITLRRADDGALNVAARGQSFNARGVLQGMFTGRPSGQQSNAGGVINLDAVIARVTGENGSEITDLNAQVKLTGDETTRLFLEARAEGSAMTIEISSAGSDGRNMRIRSANAGATLRFAGLYSLVQGGTMVLNAVLPNDSTGGIRGLLVANRFRMVDDRIAAPLAENSGDDVVGQTEIQRSEQQAGPGNYFERLNMPFVRANGVLQIGESYINGPSVGATFKGQVDFNRETINLVGTYVPLYALNNLLSNVPVFGQILTGGRNEGVLAVTFAVVGPLSDAQMIVNPVSAVAPGVFRKLFDFGAGGSIQPPRPPNTVEGTR
ncbi:MAG: hypothetical protein JKY32_11125 [Rhizobiales bacterium]|nr:hypothetical protein [Hyphomicrobiales bacterium]